MTIHTLSFPTFGSTCSVSDLVEPHNCMDGQYQVVSYHLTQFLYSSNQNHWSYEFCLDATRGAVECWWWALCLLAVRGHVFVVINGTWLWLQDAYISTIYITPMHVLFKWSVISYLVGVHTSRAKYRYFIHTRILCGTCMVVIHSSW
jgi:hypothetical protein